jgi:hypothetical protein
MEKLLSVWLDAHIVRAVTKEILKKLTDVISLLRERGFSLRPLRAYDTMIAGQGLYAPAVDAGRIDA